VVNISLGERLSQLSIQENSHHHLRRPGVRAKGAVIQLKTGDVIIMASAHNPAKNRPLSPHLSIWRWGPHMAISILHRATGDGLAIAGAMGLVWWLVAAASGPEAYASFVGHATSWYGYVVLVGLSWAFFQHLFSGLRHLVMDIGAGYELKTNKSWSLLIPALAVLATAALWSMICWGKF
jgi:succinate dehydrogenase / fumarate reductase cytochrome b subunit